LELVKNNCVSADPADWSPRMREAANALWRVLKNECRGKERARSKAVLIEDLKSRAVAVTPRELDALVTGLRNDDRGSVVTGGAGVYWAIRRVELEQAHRYLASRFDDLRIGCQAARRKLVRWDQAQQPHPAAAPQEKQERLFNAEAAKELS
jgi:hypothetical protein